MTIKVKFFDTEQFLWAKRSKWNLESWLPFHPVLVGQFITYIFHKHLGTCLESKMFCQSESTAAAVVLEYLIFNIGVVGSWGGGEEKLSHFLSARLALPCPALVLGFWSLWLYSSSLKYHLSLEKTHQQVLSLFASVAKSIWWKCVTGDVEMRRRLSPFLLISMTHRLLDVHDHPGRIGKPGQWAQIVRGDWSWKEALHTLSSLRFVPF